MSAFTHILTRRNFLRSSLASCASLGALGPISALAQSSVNASELLPPNEDGLRLLPGFRSRIVARSGQQVTSNSTYIWHDAPDGGAVFATPQGGWIYVSNSEIDNRGGGVGAIRFAPTGEIEDAYSILSGTNRNCAGGATPWSSWLSCEETPDGLVWECDPFGQIAPEVRPALGRFNHEAVAVDTRNQILYLTEDRGDGRLYRFVPERRNEHGFADLRSGHMEVAAWDRTSGLVTWLLLPDPQAERQQTRRQVRESTAFDGGEGIIYTQGKVVFATKGDDRVWSYDTASSLLSIVYDPKTSANPILSGVDNVALTPMGNYAVAEDGGDMQIVVVSPQGKAAPLLQVVGQDDSEICGPAFSPDWSRLYFSSQRGTSGRLNGGITYEITGPFAL